MALERAAQQEAASRAWAREWQDIQRKERRDRLAARASQLAEDPSLVQAQPDPEPEVADAAPPALEKQSGKRSAVLI